MIQSALYGNIQKVQSSDLYRNIKGRWFLYILIIRRILLKTCTNVIKANAKARYESTKAKQAVVKREVSAISEHLIPNYFPANRKGKKDYRELFIFEGLSVKSNGTKARDAEYQAMYTMRGVPGEAYTMSSNDVYTKNETFKNLTRAINAGIGDSFDVSKCRFDKVIICSDGDKQYCPLYQ